VTEDNLSRFKVAGWYGPMGYHIEQWAYDEGLVVTDCEECERDLK
jgi:hypothetical protein